MCRNHFLLRSRFLDIRIARVSSLKFIAVLASFAAHAALEVNVALASEKAIVESCKSFFKDRHVEFLIRADPSHVKALSGSPTPAKAIYMSCALADKWNCQRFDFPIQSDVPFSVYNISSDPLSNFSVVRDSASDLYRIETWLDRTLQVEEFELNLKIKTVKVSLSEKGLKRLNYQRKCEANNVSP